MWFILEQLWFMKSVIILILLGNKKPVEVKCYMNFQNMNVSRETWRKWLENNRKNVGWYRVLDICKNIFLIRWWVYVLK